MIARPNWRASLGAVLATLVCASPAAAGTTISTMNGVQIIVSERDAVRPNVSNVAKKHLASPAHPAAAAAVHQLSVPVVQTSELRGASTLIATALSFVGTPYVWGGAAPGGFDCSGFTHYAFARLGIAIPRTADVQFAAGRPIVGDPLPGDLVFFQTYDYGASHVGIYLGGGRFVNSIGDNVHVASFASSYFRDRYIGARRFLPG